MISQESKDHLAWAILLQHDIVSFNFKEPKTFKFGIRSPIYCDFRKTLGIPKLRTMIKNDFACSFHDSFGKDFVEAENFILAGVQTGGTPYAAILSDVFQLPLTYVRPGTIAKEYGLKKQIEGASVKGKVIVLIEDLISTGGSAIENAKILLHEGATEIKIFSIFSYGFRQAAENFAKANLSYASLLTVTDLLPILKEKLPSDEYKLLCKWVDNPEEWFEKHFQNKIA